MTAPANDPLLGDLESLALGGDTLGALDSPSMALEPAAKPAADPLLGDLEALAPARELSPDAVVRTGLLAAEGQDAGAYNRARLEGPPGAPASLVADRPDLFPSPDVVQAEKVLARRPRLRGLTQRDPSFFRSVPVARWPSWERAWNAFTRHGPEIAEASVDQVHITALQNENGARGTAEMIDVLTGSSFGGRSNWVEIERNQDRMRELQTSMEAVPRVARWIPGGIGQSPNMIGGMAARYGGLAAGAATGAIPVVGPVVAPAATAFLGTALPIAYTGMTEGGNWYADYVRANPDADKTTAALGGLAIGLVNGTLELLPIDVGLDTLTGNAKREMVKLMADREFRDVLAFGAKRWAMQVGAEGLTEALQQIGPSIGNYAKQYADGEITAGEMLRNVLSEMVDAGLQGAEYSILPSGGNAITAGGAAKVQIEKAKAVRARFQQIADTSKENAQDIATAPDKYQKMVDEAVADDGQVDTVYVEREALEKAYAEAAPAWQKLVKNIPGLEQRVADAAISGGRVRFSAGEFATFVAGGEQFDAIGDHLAFSEAQPTLAQARQFASPELVDAMVSRMRAMQASAEIDQTTLRQDEEAFAKNLEAVFGESLPSVSSRVREHASRQFARTVSRIAEMSGQNPLEYMVSVLDRLKLEQRPELDSPAEQARSSAFGTDRFKAAAVSDEQVQAEVDQLVQRHPALERVSVRQRGNDLVLEDLVVPKGSRKQGIGSAFMEDLARVADQTGRRVVLTTGVKDEATGTTSAARLKKFYKRFGFVENKGKDFTISENMLRGPKSDTYKQETGTLTTGPEARISTRQPTSKDSVEDASGGGLMVDVASIRRLAPNTYRGIVRLFSGIGGGDGRYAGLRQDGETAFDRLDQAREALKARKERKGPTPQELKAAEKKSAVEAAKPAALEAGASKEAREARSEALKKWRKELDRAKAALEKARQARRDELASLEAAVAKAEEEATAEADARLEEIKTFIKDNLRSVWEKVPQATRERTKVWYIGANSLAKRFATRYGYDAPAIAGVIASLSPQKDWNQNVSLAERVLEIWTKHQDSKLTPEMIRDAVDRKRAALKTAKRKGVKLTQLEQEAELHAFELDMQSIADKTLSELNDDVFAAMFVRAYSQGIHPREYRMVTPEGEFGSVVTAEEDEDGDAAERGVQWGGFATIGNAIAILRNPTLDVISAALGEQHKVRNFYNNIIDPSSATDITIDTHAVGVALMRALSGQSPEVTDNFGGPGSTVSGTSGTYAIYADAYRELAEELGVLPRELQSVTWEAIRSMFPAKKKKSMSPQAKAIWERYDSGGLSLEQARSAIYALTGGIPEPDSVLDPGASGEAGDTSFPALLPESGVRRGERAGGPVADAGGAADAGAAVPAGAGGTGPLRAGGTGATRGQLVVDRAFKRFLLQISSENVNDATLVHELAHLTLELVLDMAEQPGAAADIQSYGQDALRFLGVENRGQITNAHHERWAESWELYLREGKAPTPDLAGTFAFFRSRLLAIYEAVRGRLKNADHELSFVPLFDRLLATEREIRVAKAQTDVVSAFADAESFADLQPGERENVLKLLREVQAAERGRLEKIIAREQGRVMREQRGALREEIAAAVLERPEQRLRWWLRRGVLPNGDHLTSLSVGKLSRADVEALGGDVKRLPRGTWTATGGWSPAPVAAAFGYSSPEEMLDALEASEDPNEIISREVQQEAERRGLVATPEELKAMASEALEGPERDRLYEAERRIAARLRKAEAATRTAEERSSAGDAAPKPADARARVDAARAALEKAIAEQANRAEVDRLQIELKRAEDAVEVGRVARQDQAAAGKAAKEAIDAVPFKLRAALYRAAAQRILDGVKVSQLNRELAGWRVQRRRAAQAKVDAQVSRDWVAFEKAIEAEQVANALVELGSAQVMASKQQRRFLSEFKKPGSRKRARLAKHAFEVDAAGNRINYLDMIDGLLSTVDFSAISNRKLEYKVWLERFAQTLMDEKAIDLPLPSWVLDLQATPSYKDLTVDQLGELFRSVKALEKHGMELVRDAEGALAAGEQAILDEGRAALDERQPSIAALRGWFEKSEGDKRKTKASEFVASMLSLPTICLYLDNMNPEGFFTRNIIHPMRAAAARQTALEQRVSSRINAAWERYTPAERRQFYTHRIWIQSVGQGMTKNAILSIAAQQGNEHNRAALRDGKPYGFTDSQLAEILSHVTEKDADFLIDVAQAIDSLWPEAEAVQRRMNGEAAPKVVGEPWQLPSGKWMPGFYWPLKFNTELHERAHQYDEQKTAAELFALHTGALMTKPGAMNARKKTSGGLTVTADFMGTITSHVDEMTKGIAWQETLVALDRLQKKLAPELKRVAGEQLYRQFRKTLVRVARSERGIQNTGWLNRFAGSARGGLSVLAMGWRITSAMIQVTGFLPAIHRVGALNIANGYRSIYLSGHPFQAIKDLRAVVPALVNRAEKFDRDAQQKMLRLNPIDVKRPISSLRTLRSLSSHYGFYLLGMVDTFTASAVAAGALQQALNGEVEGIAQGDMEAAARYADGIVRATQGSGETIDLPEIMDGDNFQKMMTTMMSYSNAQLQQAVLSGALAYEQARDRREAKKAGRPVPTVPHNRPRFLAFVTSTYILAPIIEEMIRGLIQSADGEPPDEEEWLASLWRKIGFGPVGGIPVARDLYSYFSGYGGGETPFATTIDVWGKAILETAKAFGDDFDGEKMLRAWATWGTYETGLPTKAMVDGAEVVLQEPIGRGRK